MPNKPVTRFNFVTTLDANDVFHLVHGNVDKQIKYSILQSLLSGGGVDDAIVNDVIDRAPSQNAVYDALLLKYSGSVSDDYIPLSDGTKTFVNSTIHYNVNNLYIDSPTGNSQFKLEDSVATLLADQDAHIVGGNNIYLDATNQIFLTGAGLTTNKLLYRGSAGEILTSVYGPSDFITGSGTTDTYPVFTGSKIVGNGRISQTGSTLFLKSPNTQNRFEIENAAITSIFFDGTNQSFFQQDTNKMSLQHDLLIELQTPDIKLSNLTANSVPYLDSDKILRSSTVTPTELSYLDATSSIQTQLDLISSLVTSGIHWVEEVDAATTTNITLSGTQTVDGVALIADKRCLVKNQSTASLNGIYIVAAGAWTRATDYDNSAEVFSSAVLVGAGTVNQFTQWYCNNATAPTIGTDAITFVKINGGNVYTNGAGITLTGNAFSIAAGAITNAMLAGSIDLTTKVTNALPAANGGTGLTSYTAGDMIFWNGTTFSKLAIGTSGQVITSSGTAPTWSTLSGYIKADGTVPLTGAWDAGLFSITANGVTVGGDSLGILINGIDGLEVNVEGIGATISSNGTALLLDSETYAIDILNGMFRFNDPNKGEGKILISDADGVLTMQTPSVYSLPSSIYAAASAASTDTAIISNEIPSNAFANDGDKIIYDFFFGNNGGSAGNMTYKILLDGNVLNNPAVVPINTTSDPLSVRVTLTRSGANNIFYTLDYDFGTHTTTLRDKHYLNDTTTVYIFSSPIDIVLTANPGTTGRTVTGVFGNGQYFKAS